MITVENSTNIKFKKDYATVLNYASKKNYILLQKAIDQGFDVNQKNDWGISFFSNIVILGDEDLIKICLKAGADSFYSAQKYSESPFLFSLFRKKENILLLMLDYSSRENIINSLNIKTKEELILLEDKGIFNNIPLVLKKIKKIISI